MSGPAVAEFALRIDPTTQEIAEVSPSGGEVRPQEDVSGKVRPRIQGIDWRPWDKQIAFDVALKNCTTDETFYAPIRAVVKWMRPRGAQVLNADGELDGKPYWDYSDALGDQALDPQETSEPRRWEIYSPLWGIVLLCVRIEAELVPHDYKIAFVSDRAGHSDVYTMNSDGTGVTQVTHTRLLAMVPVWSPDGTQIAYSPRISYSPSDNDIYIVSLADGTERPVLQMPCRQLVGAWSPDGRVLYYCDNSENYPYGYAVCAVNVDGGNRRQLVPYDGLTKGLSLSFDGSMLTYSRSLPTASPERRVWIEILETESGARTVVTDKLWHDGAPSFSRIGAVVRTCSSWMLAGAVSANSPRAPRQTTPVRSSRPTGQGLHSRPPRPGIARSI